MVEKDERRGKISVRKSWERYKEEARFLIILSLVEGTAMREVRCLTDSIPLRGHQQGADL